RVGPVVEYLVEVIIAGAIEGVEEPLLVLEHGRVGLVAGFGEQGGEQAVAGGLADMQGFDHGAKIGLHAGGEGGRDGKGNGKSFLVEADQVTDGGGGTEDAIPRRGYVANVERQDGRLRLSADIE